MVTVPEASKIIIERSRYLSEALSKDLINLSSLARYIKPEIEHMLFKKVNTSSIIMALKRIKKDLRPKNLHVKIFDIPPRISVLTGLLLYRINDKNFTLPNTGYISKTDSETVVVVPQDVDLKYKANKNTEKVSAISISLPKETQGTPGVHYFFLKSLAWEGVNIIESYSNSKEYVLIFSNDDIQQAFRIITSLFNFRKN